MPATRTRQPDNSYVGSDDRSLAQARIERKASLRESAKNAIADAATEVEVTLQSFGLLPTPRRNAIITDLTVIRDNYTAKVAAVDAAATNAAVDAVNW